MADSGRTIYAPGPTPFAAFGPLKAALKDGSTSCAIQVLGDSTGKDTFNWPYTFVESLAALYPNWTFTQRLWSDTTQQYDPPTIIQTGTAGARYLDLATGTTGRRLDPAASPHISGPMDVRVKVSMTDWTPVPATVNFVGRRGTTDPNLSWNFGVRASGLPYFSFTPTGNAANLVTKDATAVLGLTDGTTNWLRVTFTPDNGASGYSIRFYTSTDGATWTQLGSTVTTAGVTSLFNASATGYECGGVAGSVYSGLKLYEVQIRDGIDGPNIVPALPDLWPRYSATTGAAIVGAPVLTLVNGSRSGGTISYLDDAARLPKLTPDYGQRLTFLSDSHNETLLSGSAWTTKYGTWRTNVETNVPDSPVVILTQNPETSGSTTAADHAQRRLDLLGYARYKHIDVIDTYQDFLDAGWPGDLMIDTVHPSVAGYLVWRDAILRRFLTS